MRFLAPLAALLLTSVTLAPNIAEACGGGYVEKPAPRVLMVSTHAHIQSRKADGIAQWGQRSFVVLQTNAVVGNRKWQWLAPGTYDSTNIIELGRLDTPMEMTLLGPSGSRVVSSDQRVALSNSWQIGMDQTRAAVEITLAEGDDFQIAIAGRARDAKWFSLGHRESNASDVWWLAKRAIVNTDFIYVQPVAGTDYELVEYIANGTSGFAVRRGDAELGRYSGSAVAAMRVNGRFLIVTKIKGQLATIEV